MNYLQRKIFERATRWGKEHLSRKVREDFGDKVHCGPLKGFTLPNEPRWSKLDIASISLGLYEKEILNEIVRVSVDRELFIDIGAADGYYSVGLLYAGIFDRSISYEKSIRGQRIIKQTAELNGVSGRIKIFGEADASFLEKFSSSELSKAVVLIDIEGAEFQLLTDNVLARLSTSVVIVEMHEHLVSANEIDINQFIERCDKWFNLRIQRTGERDLSTIEQLWPLPDDLRWLICSEGRGQLGKWLILSPKGLGDARSLSAV